MQRTRLKQAKPKQADKNYISVTGKVFELLEYFLEKGPHQESLRFQDISAALPFARTTVHRILYTLEKLGYVEKDGERSNYCLGERFFELTEPTVHFRRLRSVAKTAMQSLLLRFGETVNLATLDETHVAFIEVFQSTSALRIAAVRGERCPIHSTAVGKAILAFLPEKEVESILNRCALIKITPKTITAKRQLLEHLAMVREQGVALDYEENLSGVICVGAPIFDRRDRVVAAMSISGPASRMEPKLAAVRDEVREACSKVSQLLDPTSIVGLDQSPQALPPASDDSKLGGKKDSSKARRGR